MAMYGSPLVAVKSVEIWEKINMLPVFLISEASDRVKKCGIHAILPIFLLIHGKFPLDGLWTPEPRSLSCGSPLGILQLLLYCKYKKRRVMEEVNRWDSEKNETSEINEAKSKQLQLVVHDDTRGK
ncbi:hypothetical protein Ancab_009134 [Ancistrocladus abbreviatus]